MFRFSSRFWTCLALSLLYALLPISTQAQSNDLLLILDASGSMWGQIDGQNKIVIAREVLGDLLTDLDDSSEVGLIAYGHRREGDCQDVETIAPLATLDRGALGQTINAINPKGKTPITLSVEKAVEVVKPRDEATTIVLVSDGLETCDGDPCKAVRAAKEAGVDFVMHVVGFGIEEGDVSQLECAAQAGGGLYFDAKNANELGEALDKVVKAPVVIPDGRLSVKAIANDELIDVSIRVQNAETGEEVAVGRTYKAEDTNPRIIPLDDGAFNVQIKVIGMKGDIRRQFEGIEIKNGSLVEKIVDFSSGTLTVGVTRNGELSDATVRVYDSDTKKQVAISRTYVSEKTNPRPFTLTAGTYNVSIKGIEITSKPTHEFTDVVINGQEQTDLAYDFKSGQLTIGAKQGDELLDVTVSVLDPDTNREVGRRRTYTDPKTNPYTWLVEPGTYRVELKAITLEGKPKRSIEVTVPEGGHVEETVDFASGG